MHPALARYQTPHADDESELIKQHAGLLDRCARMMATRTGAWSYYDDLWTAGALGLVDAWRRFDAKKNTKFKTFAEHRIRGAMLDELRRMDHLPRRLRARTDALEKKKAELSQQLGRAPDKSELVEAMDIDYEEIDALEGLQRPMLPVENAWDLADEETTVDGNLLKQQRVNALTDAIAELPERMQMVLALRYTEGLTQKEIAGLLEVSEPRISQIHSEAVAKLRDILGTDDLFG